MSIKPPSDILLDVARAADPAKSSAATERLTRLGANVGVDDAQFGDVLSHVDIPRAPNAAPLPAIAEPRFANVQPEKAKDAAETKAYQGIAALLLENLVENMLPDSDEFFGAQAGAGIWRSMLAQELGTNLSKSVDLGIGPKHVKSSHSHHGLRPGGELEASLAPLPLRGAKHS
ncbi:MAG: rod-binding protein [Pseudomonadota bacterium]